MADKVERWAGRNSTKDQLRKSVWQKLETSAQGIAPIWSAIPNFLGAEEAAERLAATDFWKKAKIVKSNPDAPQIPVRRKALEQGKLLYMPVPELTKEYPYILLDPVELKKKGISFAEAAVAKGALEHGKRVQFTEMLPMEVLVVGCVAVSRNGGRTGKGAGFADLELGIFREVGTIVPGAPIVTTVHDFQVVDNSELVMQAHDSALDFVFTPTESIETKTPFPQPTGVYWPAIQPDQFRDIPFLRELQLQLTQGKNAGNC